MKKEFAEYRRDLYIAEREANCLETTNNWQFRDAFLEGMTYLENVYNNAPKQ